MNIRSSDDYRREAIVLLEHEGWEHPLSDAIVAYGQADFDEAMKAGLPPDAACEQALMSGRRHALTKLYVEAVEEGADHALAFKMLIALTRENALRVSDTDVFFPKPWVAAAAAAASAIADLGGTPEQQVLVGFKVFSAAARAGDPAAAVH